jgi:hypothetical protein
MIFNWIERGDFELEKDLQASPESYDACNPLEFYGEPILELSKPRLDSGLQASRAPALGRLLENLRDRWVVNL